MIKNLISKILFSFPIALFFGTGIFVSSDIIQPSYFKNLETYYPYFIVATIIGYTSVFLASSYISNCENKIKSYSLMVVYMIVEGLFALLAINTYYGDSKVPLIRQVSSMCLPLVFSLFYFMSIIENKKNEKTVKQFRNESEIFKDFDDLESSKRNI